VDSRLSAYLQRLAARASLSVPEPPALRSLSALRGRLAGEILGRRSAEIGRARRGGSERYGPLAESLVVEHRRAMADAAGEAGWWRWAAHLDLRLPTAEDEYMDRPELDAHRRAAVVMAVHRLSRGLGSYVHFAAALEPLLDGDETTLLDLASGHGGFPLALPALVGRGRRLRIIASDLRSEYVELGRLRTRDEGVEFRVVDAFRLDESLRGESIDVVTCTQSMHHFGAHGTAVLLGEALRHARRGVLFIDLARSLSRLLLGGAAAWLVTFDPMFLHDTALSFRKAFVAEELRLIAACVPGGEAVESFDLAPGFVALRKGR
jgi:2-polyprenyl-3-methyl-5-hydroxy-6-metoxy-1,4-benzoquinol methylase